MMNHLPAVPNVPPALPSHHSRRQHDYHYPTSSHHPPANNIPYANYHHPLHYPGPPPPQQYAQQWYQPYQIYPPPALRQYQQQSPLVVSSYPHTQPVLSLSRQPLQSPQPANPPQAQPSTLSTTPQAFLSPSATATTSSITKSTPPLTTPNVSSSMLSAMQPTPRTPFYPQLPWFSVPESTFPAKALRRRRKRKTAQIPNNALELPSREESQTVDDIEEQTESQASTITPPAETETPQTSIPPSEIEIETEIEVAESVTPLTSDAAPTAPAVLSVVTPKRTATIPIVPIIPIRPIVRNNNFSSPTQHNHVASSPTRDNTATDVQHAQPAELSNDELSSPLDLTAKPSSTPARPPPKSWAELLRSKTSGANGVEAAVPINGGLTSNGIPKPNSGSLADALRLYNVESHGKISFLEPRGLVNTGNMCYMNSILQILVFCVPFYEFLDQVGKRAVHNFKSDTPLVEAMIIFMREFSVIDSAVSVEQLRMRLKDNELETYGEAFIPEYVYDVIKRLPRFSTMRRGHQQDAEEFLGFLLEGLHDECVQVMQKLMPDTTFPEALTLPSNERPGDHSVSVDGGWLEVGPKQKSAVTRSSGVIVTESPVTKIFGGKLRSILRVPGLKDSVTLEPYQPLQLDIGGSGVFNITDALKGLTRSETLHGDFNSPRGPGTSATKQVFIETLPPVLILHLKRFQYDNTGGTQKVWKKIGYPLELEIPKEVFPPHKRGALAVRPGGLPSYRLIGVVYHHGKNASGGHYTVDVRRQEGREWIRMDDTVIRRMRSEDVASEGGEEDPKALAAALEKHKRGEGAGWNTFSQAGFDDEEGEREDDEQGGWSQVNGISTSPTATGNTKKWSGIANGAGTATPSTAGKRTPKESGKYSFKDNKVAYILFYQQIHP